MYKNKLFNVRHIFQTTMDYCYAFVMNNDNQCYVTIMITTEIANLLLMGTM